MDLLIKSAKIIDKNSPFHLKTQDVLIEKGKVSTIASNIKNTKKIKEIALDNLHISIGWFDTSVSFGEPGFEERETIVNGLKVAAKSGFTAVAMNPNTNPVIDNKSAVEFLVNKAKSNIVDMFPIANLTQQAKGQELAELFDMHKSGAIAFGDYNKAVDNANLMKIALLYAQNFDGLVLSFPQNNSLSNLGSANEGATSTKLGLKGNPAIAEELQIARDLFLLEYTGGKLHIPTITTEKSVKLIADAKKKGLDVTCSVSAHHLFLTDDELNEFNTNYKVSPPLRTKKDVNSLKKGIIDGTIDIITSDHNPIDVENKKIEFENAMEGSIGLESFFGAVNEVLPLENLIDGITNKPRKRFNIVNPTIVEGQIANITLFNPDVEYEFTVKNIFSTSKNSAFLGKRLKGKVYGIFTNNKLVIN
ncbi:dihydroorotase [Aureibaculum sp. 2210JD6-5]|uniref:dihydroorotase n=1 Tax=Aureibaculum sp. 2210JD6-5 TaxID=3103957 RepID=UPI002AAEE84D|nr:dihydroorotase [Aureibaculum sp. 2210JD6-5]MDY7395606.1 dihydroorotase [Aureibaculum sp. 2210JD6-5]